MAALHKYKQDPIWKICNIIPLSLDEIDIIEKKYNNISYNRVDMDYFQSSLIINVYSLQNSK